MQFIKSFGPKVSHLKKFTMYSGFADNHYMVLNRCLHLNPSHQTAFAYGKYNTLHPCEPSDKLGKQEAPLGMLQLLYRVAFTICLTRISWRQ